MDEGVWERGQMCLVIVRAMGREPRSEGGVGGRGSFISVPRMHCRRAAGYLLPVFCRLGLGVLEQLNLAAALNLPSAATL